MKAVIYARYSSDNQREESIEGQLRECKQYAEYNEIEIVGSYIDRALTAKTDNRPNFQQMIKDSAKGLFDVIIVWKLDRFSRNRYDSAYYKNILKKNGVRVISATEKISQDASGILFESILEGYAEFYSAELAEKVKRGMTDNALKGLWNGGSIPFGYVVKNKRLEIDEKTAPVVDEIFRMCNDGMTIKAIYENLLERKITRQNGKPLRYNAVRYILQNRMYIGEYKNLGIVIENGVPQIISKELFDSVQKVIKSNGKAPARYGAKEEYLLTTKLFCGKCGAMMVSQSGTSVTKKQYKYYGCVRQKKHQCDKKPLHKNILEDFIVRRIIKILQSDEYIDYLTDLIFNIQYNESTMLPKLNTDLENKQKEIDNIMEALKHGLAQNSLLAELEKLEKEKDEITLAIAKEKSRNPVITRDQVKVVLLNYRKINVSKIEGRRRLIDAFINSIYVYDDTIKILFNGTNREETVSIEEMDSSYTLLDTSPKKP